MGPGDMGHTTARRCSMPAPATARRPPPSSPTPHGSSWRVGPMACRRRSAPTRSPTPPWPRPPLPRAPDALHRGHAGQTIQGPDALAPADLGPRHSAVTSGDAVTDGQAGPRLAPRRRAAISPAACCHGASRLSHSQGHRVWHRPRGLLGRRAPGGRRLVVRTGPPGPLPQVLSHQKPSAFVYLGARRPLNWVA
jgi:hypothetical protein